MVQKRRNNDNTARNEIMQMRFFVCDAMLRLMHFVWSVLHFGMYGAYIPRTNATLKLPKNFHSFLPFFSELLTFYSRFIHISYLETAQSRKVYYAYSLTHACTPRRTIFKTILEQSLFLLLHNCECFIHFLVFVSVCSYPWPLSLFHIFIRHCDEVEISFFFCSFAFTRKYFIRI